MDYSIETQDVVIFGLAIALSGVISYVGKINPTSEWFTAVIANFEAQYISLFQGLESPLLTSFFIAVYLIGYPALLLISYFYLKKEGSHIGYAKSYMLVQILSLPFFYFLPVTLTGNFLDAVNPIYSQSEVIYYVFSSTGDFQRAFPSLHAGFSTVAAIWLWDNSKKTGLLGASIAGLIIFSTFYLGIHWISDALFGVILAASSYFLAKFIDISHLADRYTIMNPASYLTSSFLVLESRSLNLNDVKYFNEKILREI